MGTACRRRYHRKPIPTRRLGIAVIGQGVATYDAPLFRNLRQHGAYFGGVKPDNGLSTVTECGRRRAKAHPVPYGHWYIDGGQPADHSPLLTCVSYQALEPVRAALLQNIQAELQRPGMGPEELRTHLAQLVPSDLGMDNAGDAVLGPLSDQAVDRGFRERRSSAPPLPSGQPARPCDGPSRSPCWCASPRGNGRGQ